MATQQQQSENAKLAYDISKDLAEHAKAIEDECNSLGSRFFRFVAHHRSNSQPHMQQRKNPQTGGSFRKSMAFRQQGVTPPMSPSHASVSIERSGNKNGVIALDDADPAKRKHASFQNTLQLYSALMEVQHEVAVLEVSNPHLFLLKQPQQQQQQQQQQQEQPVGSTEATATAAEDNGNDNSFDRTNTDETSNHGNALGATPGKKGGHSSRNKRNKKKGKGHPQQSEEREEEEKEAQPDDVSPLSRQRAQNERLSVKLQALEEKLENTYEQLQNAHATLAKDRKLCSEAELQVSAIVKESETLAASIQKEKRTMEEIGQRLHHEESRAADLITQEHQNAYNEQELATLQDEITSLSAIQSEMTRGHQVDVAAFKVAIRMSQAELQECMDKIDFYREHMERLMMPQQQHRQQGQ